MHASKPDWHTEWTRRALRPNSYIAVNAFAAVVMVSAALLVPRELRHLYPIGLVWLPCVAFAGAALTGVRKLGTWMPLVALGLNIASLVLFILALFAALTDASVGPAGLAYAVPGGTVAGWNLFRLSRGLSLE